MQNYENLEIIIVDDKSSDNSVEVYSQYKDDSRYHVYYYDVYKGVGYTKCRCVEMENGDYVFFGDSDDWISDDCIEKLVKPLQNEVFDIVVGDYKSVGDKPCTLELSLPEGPYNEKGITLTFCNEGVYVMAWNKLYSKKFLNKNKLRFEEGKVHEDEILAFELSRIDKTFYVVKSVTYFYRIRENSIVTANDPTKRLANYAGVLEGVKGKVERYNNIEGIFVFYMFWIKRVFNWVSKVEMDEELLSHIQKLTKGYLESIHGVRYLKNKHDRLIYYACKREQTYLRYQYVNNEYSESLLGRIVRNVLNLLPDKQFVA